MDNKEHDYTKEAKQAFMVLQIRRGRREDGSYHVTMELNNIPKEALAIGMEEIFTKVRMYPSRANRGFCQEL